jgi:hypothetical protein
MLLSSFFDKKPAAETEPETQPVAETPQVEDVDVSLENQIAELTSQLTNSENANLELLARVAEAEGKLAGYVAEAKANTRKAQLKGVLFADKVEATYEATKALDDVAFDLIVANFKGEVEKKETDFKEVGKTEFNQQPLTDEMRMAKAAQERIAQINKGKK